MLTPPPNKLLQCFNTRAEGPSMWFKTVTVNFMRCRQEE